MTHPRQDPTRRCRPVAEWPESDRSAWATALSAGDMLDPGGPAAAWAPHTRRGVVSGWGHFLTWLDQAGELRAEETPGARITPPRLTAYVDALRQRGDAIQTILSRLHQLDRFLAAVAPGQDCTPLRRMQARLRGKPHDPEASEPGCGSRASSSTWAPVSWRWRRAARRPRGNGLSTTATG